MLAIIVMFIVILLIYIRYYVKDFGNIVPFSSQ